MRPIVLAAMFGAALLAAGCTQRSRAPVDDRRPVPTAQPSLPVLQFTPVPPAPRSGNKILGAPRGGKARREPRPGQTPDARGGPPARAPAIERDPDAIVFAWPARGRVLSGFSEPNNKGLDIAGKPGDPVLAAAGGRVMYTGTGIRGYGKLIVIKHDNNFNSVYAHNREILVQEGQNVTRGQRIAELGDTDADSPKLHFEIRKSGKPVDPARYLPSASP